MKKSLGKISEDLAAQHYQKLGFNILERNYIQHFGKQMGELDLIVTRGQDLVFVEVKARRTDKFGSALEAVDVYKQRKLVNMVKLFLNSHPEYTHLHPRIDVAVVDIDNQSQPVIIFENVIEDFY